MVGDVGGEVGGDTVFAGDDAVFFVAKVAGAEPLRAVFFVEVAACAQDAEHFSDTAVGEKGAFGVPAVEGDAEFLQVVADVGDFGIKAGVKDGAVVGFAQGVFQGGDGGVYPGVAFAVVDGGFAPFGGVRRYPGFGRAVVFVAVAGVVFACDVHYVVALVDALWQGAVAAADLHVAPIDGEGEDVHLPPGVIDVVFVVHVVAVGAQDVGQGRAVGGAAAVATCKGPVGLAETNSSRIFAGALPGGGRRRCLRVRWFRVRHCRCRSLGGC